MKPQGEIFTQLKTKTNWIAEYMKIMNAVPREFKNKMFSDDSTKTRVNTKVLFTMYDHKTKSYKILCKGTTSKDIYTLLIEKTKKTSYMEDVWLNMCNTQTELDLFNKTWLLLKKTKEMKIVNFKYKLIHNILPCDKHLCKWKIATTEKCGLCNVVGDYKHLFLECVKVQQIIPLLESYIFRKFGIKMKLATLKILIFGYKVRHEEYNDFNMWLNKLWYIIFVNYCKNQNLSIESFKHIMI